LEKIPKSCLEWLGFSNYSIEGSRLVTLDSDEVIDWQNPLITLKSKFDKDLRWIAEFCSRKDFAASLIKAVADHQHSSLELVSESHNIYSCVISIVVRKSKNVLVFRSEHLSFLVVQGVTSCDYLLFPSEELLVEVSPSHVDEDDRRGLIYGDLIDHLGELRADNIPRFVFSGVIAGHNRPAHYFYDCLIGMEQCFGQKTTHVLSKFVYIASFPGSDFWDLQVLYPCLKTSKTLGLNEAQLNEFSLLEGVGFIKIAAPFRPRYSDFYRPLLRAVDERIRDCVQDHALFDLDRKAIDCVAALRRKGSFVLWFGIATTKRRLSDQADLLISVANRLSKSRGDICIIIDGWTCALTSLPSDHAFVDDETALVRDIEQRLGDRIWVVNAIGLTAPEKAALSLLVDFHITPCGTASLWPSRFASVPGVLHTNMDYFDRSVRSQVYSSGSSLYPVGSILDLRSCVNDVRQYFIGIPQFLNWCDEEFPWLFSNQEISSEIKRDAMLWRYYDAKALFYEDIPSLYPLRCRDWTFIASRKSRFDFRINLPKVSSQVIYVMITIMLDAPTSFDEAIFMCKSSAGALNFSHMRFSIIENSVRSESGMHRFRIILPVSSAASRLVVKPRQSEGIVHFEAVTVQH
jgi:hypothetical protein